MLRYVLTRVGRALLTILLVLTFTFFILSATGDPAVLILSADAPPEALEAFRQEWGLDAPLWKQYLGYLGNLAEGNLGRSMRDGRGAWEVVAERIPLTLAITVPALLLKVAIGVTAGIVAALHRNSWVDRAVMAFSVAGYTVPSFVLGLTLMLIFAVRLGWLPAAGADSWRHAILPVLTLGLIGAAVLARFTRSAMLEVLGQPYVRTGVAKGLLWRAVVTAHAFPNAAIPTLTIAGFMLGSLVAGAVVVESVFAWPGVGRLLISAVANRDLMIVQAILLLVTVTMVSANLLVDLVYGLVDPRLRSARATGATR
jgi:peptide/nickel transport system permease protein